MEWAIQQSGVTPMFGTVPVGVEVSERSGDHNQTFVLINLTRKDQSISVPPNLKALLQEQSGNTVKLPPYGVEVLTGAK